MASRGRLLFDLNEPPIGDDEEADGVIFSLPQKALPYVNHHGSNTVTASLIPQGKVNSNAFLGASPASAFKPFNRANAAQDPESSEVERNCGERKVCSLSQSISVEMVTKTHTVASLAGGVEREEGEWSDGEDDKALQESETPSQMDACVLSIATENSSNGKMPCNGTHSANNVALAPDLRPNDSESNTNQILEGDAKGDVSSASQEEPESVLKQKEVKGIEASYALKLANNPGKRKIDEHKEAMLGKKHNRQTMFLNLEDVKKASPIKSSTPRRQSFSLAGVVRSVREVRAAPQPAERLVEKQNQKRADLLTNEGCSAVEQNDTKPDHNGDTDASILGKPRGQISDIDLPSGASLAHIPRQSSWKQSMDLRFLKNSQVSNERTELSSQASVDTKAGSKKYVSSKKQTSTNSSDQDTSVEHLLREVTSEKLWRHPGEAELQFVPGRFDCVEEYVRVFEPLIFEECRAQLYSTWEGLTYVLTDNTHAVVKILNVERRERGWYDVVLGPDGERFNIKEGDVAVLSTPRPWLFGPRGDADAVKKHKLIGRVAGTVRRFIPLETWRPPGAILHFYVGDSYDSSNEGNDDHILRKLQHKSDPWYLTTLGSLATTQREYIALHAFRRLNAQMQSAILQPSPEQFPNYEQQTPAMPDCFTQEFVEHLNKSFNGPQLGAIQWAATHTAAGTNSGSAKKQDPWPFTLVQGPPGTGKTHTVWGILNVIHLVQHQHYYNSLLKSLAPGSYKQGKEGSSDNGGMGSIDEVLQSMDQRLFRTLPKLCPKPRMLVCAPSNVATDELLTRVLDRGFIDGEMRVYRPDIARVGLDSQTPPAAQAVSVERRAEQVLAMHKDEIYGWLRRLRGNEAHFSQEIADVQNKLNSVAAAIRTQGSVGVDTDVVMARHQNRDSLLKQLAQVVENRDKVLVEIYRVSIVEAKFRAGSNYNLEEARACLETSYANEAEIVFTTVSSSGGKLLSRLSHGFDVVVIDEAAQASEMGVLPALSLGAARCVLVGDPQKLPAAGTRIYSRSLFEKFQQAGCPAMILSVQYRMHPQIRDFPSRYFYKGRLMDSESVGNLPDEVYYKDPLLRPYLFYDVAHGRLIYKTGIVAFHNPHEAHLCLCVYEHLQKTVKSMGLGKVTVGIITPCKWQLKCLQREFEEVLNSEEGKDVYINTVDAFQGQEHDIIIMSCVRASCHEAGFVANIRRMNVALTRAKRAFWVMGHANDLIQSEDWAALISDAKERNCYMDKDSVPKEFWELKTPSYKPKPRAQWRAQRRAQRLIYHPECKLVDDEFPASVSRRKGHYRPPLKMENEVNNPIMAAADRSRDGWQHGAAIKK